MKNFYFTLLFVGFSFFVSAQDLEGTPVQGLKPIKRMPNALEKTSNTTSRVNQTAKILPASAITPTGTSTEVGITEGQLSVSLTGGASYSIPIAMSPGINGVVPQVSLTYNSQGGNGVAGYGWNISGVSAITRIPSTKFHDGTIDAVDFDNLDRFAFDGQRLIVKNGGVYGGNGTVYETESFSNVKITSYGVHPSGANYGPAYFLVEYPDGSKAYYGRNQNQRSIMEWGIASWENPQGVQIVYEYIDATIPLVIKSIYYGAIIEEAGINKINFLYEVRKRLEQVYAGGQSLVNNKILKKIQVTGNGVGFRNYDLAHDLTSLGYERLTSVTEKSGDNTKSYNPTMFSYENTNELITYSPITASLTVGNISSQNTSTVSGDFDGDGKMDFLLYPTTGTDSKAKYWLFSDISSGTSTNIGWEHPVGKFDDIFPVSWLSWSNKLMPMQGWAVIKLNSSTDTTTFSTYSAGITSPIYFQYEKAYQFPKFIYYNDYNCGGNEPMLQRVNNTSRIIVPIEEEPPLPIELDIPKSYVNGDFNGDGLTDVVAIEKPITYSYQYGCYGYTTTRSGGNSYFVNLDRRLTADFVNHAGYITSNANSKFMVADFNGDGKSDIFVFDAGFLKVYTLSDANYFVLLYQNTTADTSIVLDKPILMGDYNGDGKTDFIIPKAYGNNYAKYTSTGVSFIKTDVIYSIPYQQNNSADTFQIIPSDLNNDGKTDLILVRTYRNNTSQTATIAGINSYQKGFVSMRLFRNMDSNFVSDMYKETGLQSNIVAYPLPIFLSADKLNKKLEISFASNNNIHHFQSQKDFSVDRLLSTITTGNGVTESITYQPLDPHSTEGYNSIYTDSGYTENYPNTDIVVAPTFQVVTKLEKQSTAVYKKQLFSYYGAVSNLEGLGFLGFRSTMRTNWHDDNTTIISSISKFDVNLRGANTENYSVLYLGYLSGNYTATDFISKSLLTYESELLPSKVYKIKNTISQQYNGLDNTNSETTTVYDTYNNPTQSTTTLKNGTTIEQTSVSNVGYDNQPAASTYYIGRPTSKTQSVTASGDTMTSEELYTFTNHLLSQVRKKGHNMDYITEDNIYDTFGNITKKTITAIGLTPRVTNYEYDTSGRFLTKSIDIEGLATTFAYNTSNGLLNSETNPSGLNTSYSYDAWFKKIKTTDYLGKSNTYSYTRSSEKSIVTTTGHDGSGSQEVFDDLGRKITSAVKDLNGNFSTVSYLYDIYDRNYKVSEPYFGTSPTQWNETQYDVYSRISQSISFTGKTVTMGYSGLTTTVNDGTKTKSSTKNAIGNVVAMTDTPGGTINYTYFANGNLKTTNYGGVITNIEQDGWGRKTKLIDPSAGTYTYTYNLLGETTSETNPNGVTTYTLDAVGKLTKKTIVGTNTNSESTYVYDTATKLLTSSVFKNILEGNTITNNSYEYDSYKRLFKTTETTPYATFTKQFTFDAFGRIDKKTSTAVVLANGKTSAKTIKNTYQNGSLWQILDDATSQPLWQTNTTNARGQLTTASIGNGNIAITNTYDNYGFVTQIKHDRIGISPGNVMTLNTVFDPQKGNLTSRTNSLFNWNESFQYDSLDRLTSYTNAQGLQETQTYDDRGRITQNAIGTYNYTTTAKPYQNTSVTITPEAKTYYTPKPTQNISYNSFKSPVQIEEAGIDKISFTYNDGNDRSTMFYGGLQDDKLLRQYRKHFSADGTMEIKQNSATGEVEFVTYIGGDGYTAPIVLKSNGTTQNYLYLHRDYQGSILAITNDTGQVLEKRLFDAWGNIAKVQDGTGNNLNGLTILDRGYTGHEHLQSVGLIHMNGRLYDPKLHRFLQPDNYVQDPFNTQNYNRYGYCWNNPFKYTDPSGEWIWIVVAAIVGGVVNWATHGCQFNMEGLKAFGIGAAAGTIGALTGGAAFAAAGGAAGGIGGALAGAAGGAAGAAYSQVVLSVGNHIAFGDPLMSGKEFITGIAFGGVLGGATNGIAALRNGRTFWKGTLPNPQVSPISLPSVGIKQGQAPEIKTDAKLPSTTQTNTAPTTQANTTGKVTFTKNIDGNGYKIDGLGIIDDGAGTNSVYQGIDKATGQVKYYGITERVPDVRFGEHFNSIGTGKELLRYEVIDGMENLSRINARILEQSLINQAGKSNLLNIRNSIAPKYWVQYGIKN
ncbi:RHS repeat-associated core domain-containing protein [Flavobacterium yafengii]|uniref:RHS repeat-associated core domain-containing protein n=1 Tax=Flavobacterium yafengii TaxID=3041253 RepID=A0AAW6TP57_9FLAO|nr:RHS repeat-associated core domain-containing protein [Flavobacterium yafengii]MDI5950259.1 RHS repeat-associated core domain-containing protein [Flavobacterium yafengii]